MKKKDIQAKIEKSIYYSTMIFHDLKMNIERQEIIKEIKEEQKKSEIINYFLKTEAKKLLEKNERYNNAYKEFHLLCKAYGINRSDSKSSQEYFENYVFATGGRWIDDKDLFSNNFWNGSNSISANMVRNFAERAYYADKRVAEWEIKKAEIEAMLSNTSKDKTKAKLKKKISQGEEKIKDDIEIAMARREAIKHFNEDRLCFHNAIFRMRELEENAVADVIKANFNNPIIEDLKNDRTKFNSGRFHQYGKDIIKKMPEKLSSENIENNEFDPKVYLEELINKVNNENTKTNESDEEIEM